MENVPALLGETNKTNFNKWLTFLNSLGYTTNKPFLLNSKFFDLPQNRQRVFALSILGNDYEFNIPEQKTITKKTIANFIENRFNNNKFNFEYKGWKVLDWTPKKNNSGIAKTKIDNYTTFSSEAAAFSLESVCPTITASGAMNRIKIIYNSKEKKIRLLQWQELWKLMGFQSEDVKKIEQINEKYNLIPVQYLSKQAGNSIPVVLLEAIFKNAFK